MKKNYTDKNDNLITYVILTIIFISFIGYLIYITYITKSNMKDNNTTKNKNTNSSIYEEVVTEYEIATYSTTIYDQDKNRIHNITLACQRLNGHKVRPLEAFSFNETMGKMDKDDGYKKAIGFDSNGNKIKMYGGGICQISSTLYNALLIANLNVTERHAHSRRVNYVPKDKDATVYYGGPDLKFINDTNNTILIYATTDGNTVTITLKEQLKEISKPLM